MLQEYILARPTSYRGARTSHRGRPITGSALLMTVGTEAAIISKNDEAAFRAKIPGDWSRQTLHWTSAVEGSWCPDRSMTLRRGTAVLGVVHRLTAEEVVFKNGCRIIFFGSYMNSGL
ncbi:hypothetical protein EVAR_95981_1 [Eumeta japonica]|uniref:Uncharacterized protein n=1 Tax=Eumeta variegata TaxID=151549 RepID=A0A4C1V8N3_EUMVA|nr:hypothetical protein EVAR_95981_1 [Eumeta japonica]